jgi:hypothetical protein
LSIKRISLPTGELTLTLSESDFKINDLTKYAARQNPKRGFMFVSKLLAKYWPSHPKEMVNMYQYLVDAFKIEIQGASVFIGMAEASVALGQGVYEFYLNQPVNSEHLFIHTSRYFLDGANALGFQEQHSHASQFYLYVPHIPKLRNIFLTAQTLVLIDDEVTTGTTVVNLIHVYKKVNPHLQKILIVSILSFVDHHRELEIRQLIDTEVIFINAVAAQINFKPFNNYQYTQVPNVNSPMDCKRHNTSFTSGRLGISGKLKWDKVLLQSLIKTWNPDDKVLVLGTGEFVHLAFLIAYYIYQKGWDVKVQSTARSPLLKGESIQEKIEITDNYGDNIPNYLYNVKDGQYNQVLICHETPLCKSLSQIAQRFNADLLYYVDGKIFIS